MNPLISIIIPAYNATKFIQRCLDSIYELPLKDAEYEIIAIDDCSTDDTFDVLLKNQHTHTNLIILQQEKNQRQGAARNRGIKEAKGDWIIFVDADDKVVADGIMSAFNNAVRNKCDIVAFDYSIRYLDGHVEDVYLFSDIGKVCSGCIFLNNYVDDKVDTRGTPWGYIYSSKFLKKQEARFIEERIYEDADVVFEWIINCNRFNLVHSIGYEYILTEGSSVLREKNARTLADSIHLEYRKIKLARKYYYDLPQFGNLLQGIAYKNIAILLNTYIFKGSIIWLDCMKYLDDTCINEILNKSQLKLKYNILLRFPEKAELFVMMYNIYFKIIND